MATAQEANVAPWKREIIGGLLEKFERYPVVGILNISGIPAPQFQEIRELLRDKAEIKVSRRTLLNIAIEEASEKEPSLEELADYLEGPSALVFTEMNPFKLWKLLEENKTTAPAKPGMESPEDIVIPEGDTEFSPGPIVGDLQRAGVNARIQAGKVVVAEDSKIVEEGEEISEEEVSVLSHFGIEPREIGFELRAAYSDGTVFSGDTLRVDEEETFSDIQAGYMNSLKLSLEVQFPTERSLRLSLGQASSQAHNLALNASIFTSEITPQFLSEASSEMFSLASKLASEDPDSVGEELSSMVSAGESPEKTKKGKGKPKEGAKEEKEEIEEEETEEGETTAGLGGLFE